MNSIKRGDLLQSIATTIADYRQGEIPQINANHVNKWVNQFEADDQLAILQEMDHLLKRYYVSLSKAQSFIRKMITEEKLFGNDPRATLIQTEFLHIQRKGSSQKHLLTVLEETIRTEYGLELAECGKKPSLYVYLDDCLYSGNTARYDLEAWLPTAQANTKLLLIFFASHTRAVRYVSEKLNPITRRQSMTWQSLRLFGFHNIPWESQNFDCLWPRQAYEDHLVEDYVRQMTERNRGMRYPPRCFRPDRVPFRDSVFSSPELREALERNFLKAGAYIISLCDSPKLEMRPLGYEKLESLGFGSIFVTYRNVANNCPLALWWGDPTKPPDTTLGKWYPLFPRKTNEPVAALEFFVDDDTIAL